MCGECKVVGIRFTHTIPSEEFFWRVSDTEVSIAVLFCRETVVGVGGLILSSRGVSFGPGLGDLQS